MVIIKKALFQRIELHATADHIERVQQTDFSRIGSFFTKISFFASPFSVDLSYEEYKKVLAGVAVHNKSDRFTQEEQAAYYDRFCPPMDPSLRYCHQRDSSILRYPEWVDYIIGKDLPIPLPQKTSYFSREQSLRSNSRELTRRRPPGCQGSFHIKLVYYWYTLRARRDEAIVLSGQLQTTWKEALKGFANVVKCRIGSVLGQHAAVPGSPDSFFRPGCGPCCLQEQALRRVFRPSNALVAGKIIDCLQASSIRLHSLHLERGSLGQIASTRSHAVGGWERLDLRGLKKFTYEWMPDDLEMNFIPEQTLVSPVEATFGETASLC